MDANQYQQLANYMSSIGLNPADPNHRAHFLPPIAQQPMYATNRTGPPVNITQGHIRTEARGIFVRNLNFNANEEAISAYFVYAGPIISLDLQRDHQTKKSRGNCTIHFGSAKSAQTAIAMFHNKPFMNMRLHVREAKECTAINAPSAGPATAATPAPPSQSAAVRNGAPPLIVSSTPTQSHRVATRVERQV